MNYKKIVLVTFGSTISFVLFFVLCDQVFGDSLVRFCNVLLAKFGWIAVFLTFLFSAICIVPVPDHAISILAWMGGLNTLPNIIYATVGSAVGATIAFFLGKMLSRLGLMRRMLSKQEEKSHELLSRYGATGIIIACATPLPDAPIYWLAGILGYRYPYFIALVLIFRGLKVTYVLILAQYGIGIF